MKPIHVLLDTKLLCAADRAARHSKLNRSALIRDTLREHIRRLDLQAMEKRDRQGYSKTALSDETALWESEAAWPEG